MGKIKNFIQSIKDALNPYENEGHDDAPQDDGAKLVDKAQKDAQEEVQEDSQADVQEDTQEESPVMVNPESTSSQVHEPSEPQSQAQEEMHEPVDPQDPVEQPSRSEKEAEPEQIDPSQPNAVPPVILSDNVIDTREKLSNMIVKALKPSCGISQDAAINMSFYVTDPLIVLAMNEDFKDALRAKLENNGLSAFANGEFRIVNGCAPQVGTIQVFEGFYISLDRNTTITRGQNPLPFGDAVAVLAIVGNMGSLQDSQYELDTSKKTLFQIGRGTVVRRSGIYRVNDVIIKDDETDSRLAGINNCVSSMQADILWKNGAFYLRAMPSGCRPEGGSSTKIIRDSKSIELRNSRLEERLYDNDMIELGGDLLLSFHLKS